MESKKLKYYDEVSPISHLYDFGLTPDDIKASIIHSFSPYFTNQDNLQKHAISDLTSNWLAYLSVYKEYPEDLKFIDSLLLIFNEAKNQSIDKTIESYAQWMPEFTQSLSRFWSLHNNQMKLNSLGIEDFLAETMHMIGQTIEGLSKSFIKLILQLNRIRRNKDYSFSEIKGKDLGVAIDELINTSDLSDLLILQPNDIRLNQWRNIAYHHNTKIVDKEIICWYNKSGETLEFNISRFQLTQVLKRVLLIFKLIRISETVFAFDNLDKVKLELNKIDNKYINIRDDARVLDVYSLLESQGFKTVELTTSDRKSKLVVQDLEPYGDFTKRAIHSSQFLYELWLYSESEHLTVEYRLFNGTKFLTSEIDNINFVKANKTTELSELLKNVKFIPHVIDYQNSNPIDIVKLPKELTNTKSIYFSQLGDELSLVEFANQFTLSVFCNFLVLKSEGFEENDISINVGSDGSMVIGEKEKKPMIFHVPAAIPNKALQNYILDLIKMTIELYEKGKLKLEIVESAKENNRFYFKKSQIRERLMDTEDNK
ncbi:hypothetical protein [Draconibacterium sediminis]|mgnify:CR=1 FL=1|uniref:hypothetical protein n=1 Tax=Draconibacterium sediminis TaxID=1544798 RepID=UPI0026EBD29D|nr:hypothetical protein [Draconibacterium sediminis]